MATAKSHPKQRRPSCPACKSGNVIPIVYGEPPGWMFDAEERGELVIGGCIVDPLKPEWCCKACGAQFGGAFDAALRRALGRTPSTTAKKKR